MRIPGCPSGGGIVRGDAPDATYWFACASCGECLYFEDRKLISFLIGAVRRVSELRLNSFTKKYIKNMIARIIGYIEEQTGIAFNYYNYMNMQTKNSFEIEHIITDYCEWFTDEYADREEFKRWRNYFVALLF